MIRIIQNLRIGTKLAITSALSILLVGGMIYLQMTGGVHVREDGDAATAADRRASAAEAKARSAACRSVFAILPFRTPADLQKATEYFGERQAAALKFIGEMEKLSKSAENRERIAKLTTLVAGFRSGKDQLEAVRKEAVGLETKRGNGEPAAEASARASKLADEAARIRREVTLPISVELETIANKIVTHSKERSAESRLWQQPKPPRSSGRR